MAKETKKQAKLGKFFKSSKKALIRARDFYVQFMTKCDGNVDSYGGSMGGPAVQYPTAVPRSFSASSLSTRSDEDLRELIRVASARSLGGDVDQETVRRQQLMETRQGAKVVPRSLSVAIERIDEDKPCDFEEEVKVKTYVYPRSKSYAVRIV